jgi:hypothetical protein
MRKAQNAVTSSAQTAETGGGRSRLKKMHAYAPMAINPACLSDSCPMMPMIMFTLTAMIAFTPASVKIPAVYASITTSSMRSVGRTTAITPATRRTSESRTTVLSFTGGKSIGKVEYVSPSWGQPP